jgi:hypothetical protein
MGNYLWVIERSVLDGKFMPVDFEFTKKDAKRLAKVWSDARIKTRIRKYIPASNNGEGGQ